MSAPTQVPGYVAGTWAIDPAHTEVIYSVKHLGLAKSKGSFTGVSGQIVTGERVVDSTVRAEIDVASLSSGNDYRDQHVLSSDFFDAENHPTITFASTGIREDGENYLIDGELTVRGTTQPVTLKAELNGVGPNPANDNATTIGVSAETVINRRDFGVGPEGGQMVSENVTITIEVEAALQQ